MTDKYIDEILEGRKVPLKLLATLASGDNRWVIKYIDLEWVERCRKTINRNRLGGKNETNK